MEADQPIIYGALTHPSACGTLPLSLCRRPPGRRRTRRLGRLVLARLAPTVPSGTPADARVPAPQ